MGSRLVHGVTILRSKLHLGTGVRILWQYIRCTGVVECCFQREGSMHRLDVASYSHTLITSGVNGLCHSVSPSFPLAHTAREGPG